MVLAGEVNPGDRVTVDARDGRIEIEVAAGESEATGDERATESAVA